MHRQQVGILHPGEMGISVAATIQNSGHTVHWVSQGRSPQTHTRAEKYGLNDARSLSRLCETCSILVSVCPPAEAEAIAKDVLAHNFAGIYVDMNAISPQRAKRIGQSMADAGATFVDGGIIGGPAWTLGNTRLYLAGEAAEQVTSCFSAGPLEAVIIGEVIGKASALKMCYAAYTKGTTALLTAVLATAEALDVRAELEGQWSHEPSDLVTSAAHRVRQVTAKAWRFVGEMDEIAATFEEVGTPNDFHRAAAEIYRRLANFKNAPEMPTLEDVLQAVLHDTLESTS